MQIPTISMERRDFLCNVSIGVNDVSLGNEILFHLNQQELIANNIRELSGIYILREGQISNRETVGDVEREGRKKAIQFLDVVFCCNSTNLRLKVFFSSKYLFIWNKLITFAA